MKAVLADGTETNYSNTIKVILGQASSIKKASIASQLKTDENRVTILINDDPSAIYSVIGLAMPKQGTNTYILDKGIYIVRIGSRSTKILVE